jgi:hypothetical protein
MFQECHVQDSDDSIGEDEPGYNFCKTLFKVDAKAEKDLNKSQVQKLKALLLHLKDVSRSSLNKDCPVMMTPFVANLNRNAIPRLSKETRYSPEHRKFMRRCLKWNLHSKYSSPVMIDRNPAKQDNI